MRPIDLGWIAGFLEGEGSFIEQRKQVSITCAQVQVAPLERLVALVGGKIYQRAATQRHGRNAQAQHVWVLGGAQAVGLIMTLDALMSPKRKDQIRNVLARWRDSRGHRRRWTHCQAGHPYSPENTNIDWRGSRCCRICSRASSARKVNRKRERMACAS